MAKKTPISLFWFRRDLRLNDNAGLYHALKGPNPVLCLFIFDKDILTIDKINKHYSNVPPKISIEIDLDIELEGLSEYSYISLKTRKLLEFGAEKVIWFLSESKNIMIATPQNNWEIQDWDKDVEIFEGIICNAGKYLREKGSEFA